MRLPLGIVAGALAFAGQVAAQDAPAPDPALPQVEIRTTAGTLAIEVDTKRAPITAANFLRYVDGRKLDGVRFYRVVKVAPEFGFVQFGPAGDVSKILPPIRHESTSQTGLSHTDGVISVARLAPGTARGEFTLMVGDQSRGMDAAPGVPADGQGYAAFGRIVRGRDVLLRILDTPVDADRTDRGAFRGEMPADPVRVLSAARVKAAPPPQ